VTTHAQLLLSLSIIIGHFFGLSILSFISISPDRSWSVGQKRSIISIWATSLALTSAIAAVLTGQIAMFIPTFGSIALMSVLTAASLKAPHKVSRG
jgi:uncharacterized BrkB/YihY/UPF0761 family membrane protein